VLSEIVFVYTYIYIFILLSSLSSCGGTIHVPPPVHFSCHLVTVPQTRFWFPRFPCTVGYDRTCIAERLQVRLFLTERCVIIVGRLTMNGSGHLRMTHKLKNSNPVTRWQGDKKKAPLSILLLACCKPRGWSGYWRGSVKKFYRWTLFYMLFR
jgi:hypothetical protein